MLGTSSFYKGSGIHEQLVMYLVIDKSTSCESLRDFKKLSNFSACIDSFNAFALAQTC